MVPASTPRTQSPAAQRAEAAASGRTRPTLQTSLPRLTDLASPSPLTARRTPTSAPLEYYKGYLEAHSPRWDSRRSASPASLRTPGSSTGDAPRTAPLRPSRLHIPPNGVYAATPPSARAIRTPWSGNAMWAGQWPPGTRAGTPVADRAPITIEERTEAEERVAKRRKLDGERHVEAKAAGGDEGPLSQMDNEVMEKDGSGEQEDERKEVEQGRAQG